MEKEKVVDKLLEGGLSEATDTQVPIKYTHYDFMDGAKNSNSGWEVDSSKSVMTLRLKTTSLRVHVNNNNTFTLELINPKRPPKEKDKLWAPDIFAPLTTKKDPTYVYVGPKKAMTHGNLHQLLSNYA